MNTGQFARLKSLHEQLATVDATLYAYRHRYARVALIETSTDKVVSACRDVNLEADEVVMRSIARHFQARHNALVDELHAAGWDKNDPSVRKIEVFAVNAPGVSA